MTTHRNREVVITGLVGYARVSTLDQKLDLQEKALKCAHCLKIFTDIASGKRGERPGLEEAMRFLREGDTLVVWKLDRLGRSLQHLIEILNDLEKRGVKFRSLTEHIQTDTAAGKMFFQMVGMFAEFEREQIRERTLTGLAAARARGRNGGRKPKLDTKKIAQGKILKAAQTPIAQIAATLGCSERTARRYL
jgi:DNA invertase Pin-like site-specific DNA recombinase